MFIAGNCIHTFIVLFVMGSERMGLWSSLFGVLYANL